MLAFAEQLDHELSTTPAEEFLAYYALEGELCSEGAYPGDGEAIRGVLLDASLGGRRCRIDYVKPDSTEPEQRAVDPYTIIYANGHWYVIGAADATADIRVFRLDRILAVAEQDETFEIPGDFDPTEYMSGGRVYRADEDVPVVVRYSADIGRWSLERGEGVERPDGSVVVEHRAADPAWAVRHVMQYATEAEILEPPSLRGLAGRAARAVAETHDGR